MTCVWGRGLWTGLGGGAGGSVRCGEAQSTPTQDVPLASSPLPSDPHAAGKSPPRASGRPPFAERAARARAPPAHPLAGGQRRRRRRLGDRRLAGARRRRHDHAPPLQQRGHRLFLERVEREGKDRLQRLQRHRRGPGGGRGQKRLERRRARAVGGGVRLCGPAVFGRVRRRWRAVGRRLPVAAAAVAAVGRGATSDGVPCWCSCSHRLGACRLGACRPPAQRGRPAQKGRSALGPRVARRFRSKRRRA